MVTATLGKEQGAVGGHGWALGMGHVGEGIPEEVLFELRSGEEERHAFLCKAGAREAS